jgi:peptidoglycan/LPS O-acetylase OafA/YrhL
MGRILFLQNVPLPIFYRRRIYRIVPAVLAFLTVVTIAYLAAERLVHWDEVLTAALFLKNYFFVGSHHATLPFAHIWSLCVEEHSYIVLSLAALAFRKQLSRPKVMLWLLAAFTAVMAVTYSLQFDDPKFLPWEMLIRNEVSAFGILVSAALLVTLNGKRTILPWFTIPALFAFGLAINWYWRVPEALRLIIGVGSLSLAVNLLS